MDVFGLSRHVAWKKIVDVSEVPAGDNGGSKYLSNVDKRIWNHFGVTFQKNFVTTPVKKWNLIKQMDYLTFKRKYFLGNVKQY